MPTEFTNPTPVPALAPGSLSAEQAIALLAHLISTQNPHAVTKAQVGLPNVDNTADSQKPVSTAQAAAIAAAVAGRATTAQGQKADTAIQQSYFGPLTAKIEFEGIRYGGSMEAAARFRFTAKQPGRSGNDIRIVLATVEDEEWHEVYPPPSIQSIVVEGTIITVTMINTANGIVIAADLVAAINACAPAFALVLAEVIVPSDDKGYSAFSVQLAGGADNRFASEDDGYRARSAVRKSLGAPVNGMPSAPATATIGEGNAAMLFTSATHGSVGNGIAINVWPASFPGASQMQIDVYPAVPPYSAYPTVVIYPEQNALGVAVSTASEIIAGVNANPGAAELVVASLPDGSSGEGIPNDQFAPLAGGVDWTGTPGTPGDIKLSGSDIYFLCEDYQWRKSTLTNVLPPPN